MTNPLAQRPIFIVGTPRAGTTLVSRILGRHPALFSPGETHYFEDIWARRETLGDLETREELTIASERLMTVFGRFNQLNQTLVDEHLSVEKLVNRALELGGGYDGLYSAFMGLLAETADKPRFCDDTPKHLFYLDTIFRLYPEARVIGCVRDPRDFLCSYKNFWRKSGHSDRLKALYHPIVTALLWRSSANVMQQNALKKYPGRMIWVQYEALVNKPHEEVKRLCEFADLPYTSNLLEVESHNSSFDEGTSGIFSSSVGRWQTCLEDDEVWWAQRLTKQNMETFGYLRHTGNPSLVGRLKIMLTAPLGFIRALQANAEHRGPLIPYLWRRFLALMGR